MSNEESASRIVLMSNEESISRIVLMSIKVSNIRIVHIFLQCLLHLYCAGNKALSSIGNFEENINNPTLQICEQLTTFTTHNLHLSYM